jgi:hypothetical protein
MTVSDPKNRQLFSGLIFQNSDAVAGSHSHRDSYRRFLIGFLFFCWVSALISTRLFQDIGQFQILVYTLFVVTGVSVAFLSVWFLYALRWCSVERTLLNLFLSLEVLAALGFALAIGVAFSFVGEQSPLGNVANGFLALTVKVLAGTCAALIPATGVKIAWVRLLDQRSDLMQDREFFELVGRKIEEQASETPREIQSDDVVKELL